MPRSTSPGGRTRTSPSVRRRRKTPVRGAVRPGLARHAPLTRNRDHPGARRHHRRPRFRRDPHRFHGLGLISGKRGQQGAERRAGACPALQSGSEMSCPSLGSSSRRTIVGCPATGGASVASYSPSKSSSIDADAGRRVASNGAKHFGASTHPNLAIPRHIGRGEGVARVRRETPPRVRRSKIRFASLPSGFDQL